VAVGILLIASFEFGFSTGQRRIARLRSEIEAQLASAKPTGNTATIEPKQTPKETPIRSILPSPEPASPPAKLPEKSAPAKDPTPARPKKEEPAKTAEPAKPAESTVALKFESDILPILQTKCISCHGSLSKKGGLDLRSLSSLVRGGNSGPGLKPGQPDDSPLWQTVKAGQMPPANKPQLTAEEKQRIVAWIAGGAR
jgi:periplasmic protein TonB